MNFRETMSAEQAPDVYAGKNCDAHEPRWVGSGEGDKNGDQPIGDTLELYAPNFPPGTVIKILEPECPHCGSVPSNIINDRWECDCDFDWHQFADEHYS